MPELQWNDEVRAPATSHEARLELAAVCRLVARYGIAPLGAARIAVRDPERPDVYFLNPGGLLLDEVSRSSVIGVTSDGVRLHDGKPEADSGALEMVLAALAARPDAVMAAQVATTAGCVVASLRNGLLPMTQTAFMFHGAIETYDWDPTTPMSVRRGDIARQVANNRALLIRGRGLLALGNTAAQAWKLLFFLDKCCRSQVAAMAAAHAGGRQLTIPSQAVVEHAVAQSRSFVDHARFVADWPSYLDQLDNEDASYRE